MYKKIMLELIWWIFTLLIIVLVIYPIWSQVPSYPFLKSNVLFIAVFITFTRYIFLLKHTFLDRLQYVKIAIVLFSLLIVAYIINEINYFQTFLDEEGASAVLPNLPFEKEQSLIAYIRNEMLLFGVGSVIAAVVLPIRLLISIWKQKNRG